MSTKIFGDVLQKFVDKSPATVMVHGLPEYLLNEDRLNEWFDKNCGVQYTRTLLFSSVAAVMTEVVCQIKRNINSAYRRAEHINVSLTSLYNKINGTESSASAAPVRHIAAESSDLIKKMKSENPAWLPGYRTKLPDGNCIAEVEHRIKPLRNIKSAALPGKSLVVSDPQSELAADVFPCEDGHAQERLLLDNILKTVKKNDCIVADRNFCTQDFLFGINKKKAVYVVRRHRLLPVENLSGEKFAGENGSGKIYERKISLRSSNNEIYNARLITVRLNRRTRNNDSEIQIVTNIPEETADAVTAAEIYKKRWGIETAFQRLEAHFNGEISSLGYPKAAIFGFCLALVAFSIYAVVMASLRSAHTDTNIKEEVSEYYTAQEISGVYEGMIIAADYKEWDIFRNIRCAEMTVLLMLLARQINLRHLKKADVVQKKKNQL